MLFQSAQPRLSRLVASNCKSKKGINFFRICELKKQEVMKIINSFYLYKYFILLCVMCLVRGCLCGRIDCSSAVMFNISGGFR